MAIKEKAEDGLGCYGRFVTRKDIASAQAPPSGEELSPADDFKVSFPIGFKLVSIITLLFFLSLGLVIGLVWFLVRQDIQKTAERNNLIINYRASMAAEMKLQAVYANVSLFLYDNNREAAKDSFFLENPGIAALVLTGTGRELFLRGQDFFLSRELDPDLTEAFLLRRGRELGRSRNETILLNAAADFGGLPILVMGFPFEGKGAAVFFSSEDLADSFGTGANVSLMAGSGGEVLIHPDRAMLLTWPKPVYPDLVTTLRESGGEELLTRYRDAGGEEYLAALRRLETVPAVVLTLADEDLVFEGINATTRRNLYLSLGVWSLAVLIFFLLAKTISVPLRELRGAAEAIEDGMYHLDLDSRGRRDETGMLTESVIRVSNALGNFEKLTNKVVARLARRGRLPLGGADREATFFFSDIRAFTAISEKMSPEEVVEFLNDYMDRMVACVILTGGVIDKFIGDAVMAHWGAVEDLGTPAENALNAVRSALMMRASLRSFNQGRGEEKKPIIKIGCGLNSGTVVAGQIGSDERLEYTVIGDAVSLADRTETFNKPFGTEILITENTWRLVRKSFLTEELPAIKNGGQRVRMFAVINSGPSSETEVILELLSKVPKIDMEVSSRCLGSGGPQSLDELRNFLGTPIPDLSKVNLDEEEKKYKVQPGK